MVAGGVFITVSLRCAWFGATLACCLTLSNQHEATGQETGGTRPARAAQSNAGQDEYEDIFVNVPNIGFAGRILREVGILKAQEGFPLGDGEPRFDAETNKLYFRTSARNAAAMKKILAQIESGAGAAAPERDTVPRAASKPAAATKVFAIEIWLVQLQLPKGEVVELSGPRAEMLTILGGLEKESKAELLNHVYLTAEEQKQAQAVLNESIAVVSGMTSLSSGGRREGEGGAAAAREVSAAVTQELIGAQFKVTPQVLEEGPSGQQSVLLDYTVSKSSLSKADEGSLIPTDASGGGYRRPSMRLFEVESTVRAPLGEVRTVSSQLRGGEKPSEIRVLVLVNPL